MFYHHRHDNQKKPKKNTNCTLNSYDSSMMTSSLTWSPNMGRPISAMRRSSSSFPVSASSSSSTSFCCVCSSEKHTNTAAPRVENRGRSGAQSRTRLLGPDEMLMKMKEFQLRKKKSGFTASLLSPPPMIPCLPCLPVFMACVSNLNSVKSLNSPLGSHTLSDQHFNKRPVL